jgi:RNA polymerase sigma-70 factor (ECF subfamily)
MERRRASLFRDKSRQKRANRVVPRERLGFFGYKPHVLSLSPALMQIEVASASTLLDLARAGDTEAYGELCRAFETRLLRQGLTLCGNESLAEELAHDSLVEGWKSLHRYNGKCQFFTWLCAIMLNRYRNVLRRRRSAPFQTAAATEEIEKLTQKVADPGSAPDSEAQLRERAVLIMQSISSLPQKYQEIIYLRFYVDNSLEGIAEALGCSVGTVKSRLFRALDKLRESQQFKSNFLPL